jgi:hypothetical protein
VYLLPFYRFHVCTVNGKRARHRRATGCRRRRRRVVEVDKSRSGRVVTTVVGGSRTIIVYKYNNLLL